MNNKLFGIISVVLLLIVIAFYALNVNKNYKSLSPKLAAAHIMHNPDRKLPVFSLLDHNGGVFNNDNLKGDWSLVLFIYTHCPDVCPTELANMSMLKSYLESKQATVIPNVVAITFDPLRDTPKVLKTYVTHFDKDFIGVSGDQKEIDQLVKYFGAYYERVIYDDNDKPITLEKNEPLPINAIERGYIINHTARIYLLSPDGQVLAGFPTPHNVKNMASDIDLIVENY